jgi:type IV pilus assembly protein PilV
MRVKKKIVGASLLEVLIAIVIMSFGLLALAGMTTASLQYSKIAQFQTIGIQLSVDVADRMRANSDGFVANSYNKTTPYSSVTAAITVPTCAVAAACTPAEIASIDLAQWRNALRTSMPGGDAFVRRDTANPLAVDIWIMWTDVGLATNLAANGACPAAALVGVTDTPRCLYFRAVI